MKMLRSEYIIRFFGQRTMGSTHYLFLEYADGGELFDRIGTCTYSCTVFISLLHNNYTLFRRFLRDLEDPRVHSGFSIESFGLLNHVETD